MFDPLFISSLTLNAFLHFCIQSGPRPAIIRSTLFAYENMIYLIKHKWTYKVIYLFLYHHECLLKISIHNGLGIARIFMK